MVITYTHIYSFCSKITREIKAMNNTQQDAQGSGSTYCRL